MKWPEVIDLRFVEQRTGEPVEDLVVFLKVLAEHKNSYSLGPFVIDSSGQLVLERSQIENTIEEMWESAPMDYTDTLEECRSLEVIVESAEALYDRVHRLEQFYPKEAAHLEGLLEKDVTNERFKTLSKIFPADALADPAVVMVPVK